MARLLTWNAPGTVPEGLADPPDKDKPLPNLEPADPQKFFHLWVNYASYMKVAQRRLATIEGKDRWVYVVPMFDGSGFVIDPFEWTNGGYQLSLWTYAKCEHDTYSERKGRSYYRHTCTKCGLEFHIDSSD